MYTILRLLSAGNGGQAIIESLITTVMGGTLMAACSKTVLYFPPSLSLSPYLSFSLLSCIPQHSVCTHEKKLCTCKVCANHHRRSKLLNIDVTRNKQQSYISPDTILTTCSTAHKQMGQCYVYATSLCVTLERHSVTLSLIPLSSYLNHQGMYAL